MQHAYLGLNKLGLSIVLILINMVKGSIFLRNIHFITQERFNILIYGINKVIKSGTFWPVKMCEMKYFLLIAELMLPTLIQRHYKESFHF